ncbi:hypothetical protein D9M68_822720 [compost metagenome]
MLDLHFGANVGALKEAARLVDRELGMDVAEQGTQLAHPQEARQASHVGNEGDVFHQAGAAGKGIFAQHADGAFAAGEPQHGIERSGLAGTVVADQAIDAAGENIEIEPVQDFLIAELLAQAARRHDGFDGLGRVGGGQLSHFWSPEWWWNWRARWIDRGRAP